MVISCRHGSWEWSAGHIWATTALPKPAPSKPASSSAQHKLITFHCPPRNTPERCSWASRAGNRTFDPSKCVQRQIFRRRRVPTGRLLAFNAKPGSIFHSKITCNGNGNPTLLTVTQTPDVILLAWLPLIMVPPSRKNWRHHQKFPVLWPADIPIGNRVTTGPSAGPKTGPSFRIPSIEPPDSETCICILPEQILCRRTVLLISGQIRRKRNPSFLPCESDLS